MNGGESDRGGVTPVQLVSDSLATDGGYVAIADMARILKGRNHRPIGGIAVKAGTMPRMPAANPSGLELNRAVISATLVVVLGLSERLSSSVAHHAMAAISTTT